MNKIKISVIVPIYNVEKYITGCMDSLVSQAFDNYEIIAVNDGTPDNSMKYVYELEQKHPNIKICERENGGLSAARNTGIEHASGKYIMFCDSDDELQTNCLQMLYDEAEKNNLDMLLYDAECIYDEIVGQGKSDNPYMRCNITEKVLDGGRMLEELLEKGKYTASACLYLMKRDFLIQNKLKFYEGILHEDELFTPVAIINTERIEHRNWLIYKRHFRDGSIMTSNNMDKRMKSFAVVIKELTRFMNCELETINEKKFFKRLISDHVKFYLGQTLIIDEIDDELRVVRKEIIELARKNRISLGLEFRCYLAYLYLKRWNEVRG